MKRNPARAGESLKNVAKRDRLEQTRDTRHTRATFINPAPLGPANTAALAAGLLQASLGDDSAGRISTPGKL